jgi:hypothetical protein
VALVPTDPVTARAIAIHTEGELRQIRECTSVEAVNGLYDGFVSYANKEGVCEQIREHVRDACREMAITIQAKEKAALREQAKNTANRMTGEAA